MFERFRVPSLDLLRGFVSQGTRTRFVTTRGNVAVSEGTVYLRDDIRARRPDGSIVIINHFRCKPASSWQENRTFLLQSTRTVGGIEFIPGYYREPFWEWPLVGPDAVDESLAEDD